MQPILYVPFLPIFTYCLRSLYNYTAIQIDFTLFGVILVFLFLCLIYVCAMNDKQKYIIHILIKLNKQT